MQTLSGTHGIETQTLSLTELKSLGILEWQIEYKSRHGFKHDLHQSGEVSREIVDMLSYSLRSSSAKVLDALARWTDANATDRSGPAQLVSLLQHRYGVVSDQDGLPVSALLGQDRQQYLMLREACDEAGFSLLICEFNAHDEEIIECWGKDDIVCFIEHVSDARGKRVFKESSMGLLADEVVQDYSDIHTTVHALLILPDSYFLQLLEYELERRDAQRLIAYLLDAWRSGDSKEIPLKRLLHLCTHFIMGKEETPD
jgi:hypothetical protein